MHSKILSGKCQRCYSDLNMCITTLQWTKLFVMYSSIYSQSKTGKMYFPRERYWQITCIIYFHWYCNNMIVHVIIKSIGYSNTKYIIEKEIKVQFMIITYIIYSVVQMTHRTLINNLILVTLFITIFNQTIWRYSVVFWYNIHSITLLILSPKQIAVLIYMYLCIHLPTQKRVSFQ